MGYEAQMWIEDYTYAPRVKSDFGSLIWYQSHRMEVPLPSPAFDLYHHDPIQEVADAALSVEDLAERIRQTPALSEINEPMSRSWPAVPDTPGSVAGEDSPFPER